MDFAFEVLVNIHTRTSTWLRLAGRCLVPGVMLAVGVWGWRWLAIGNGRNLPHQGRHAALSQDAASDSSDPRLPDDPADALTRFVAAGSPGLGMDRAWTSGAVVRLARAIAALIDANGLHSVDVHIAVMDLQARGRALARIGPDALMHADIAREAFVWAASLLTTVQQQQNPHDAILATRLVQLDARARAIRPDEPLATQHQAVVGFLREAADLIQRLVRDKRPVVAESSGA
jgi:hypothetical protein